MAQPKEMAIATDASRVLQFVADNIEDPEFAEDLRIYFNLPIMVPKILLPGRVTRQHFSQWHPHQFREYSCREGRSSSGRRSRNMTSNYIPEYDI